MGFDREIGWVGEQNCFVLLCRSSSMMDMEFHFGVTRNAICPHQKPSGNRIYRSTVLEAENVPVTEMQIEGVGIICILWSTSPEVKI